MPCASVSKRESDKEENEMITARQKADGSFEVANGHMRLKVLLEVYGKAEVLDMETGHIIHVHKVDGHMVALSEDSQANVEDLANAAINRARS
jgi:hypothetical protein